MFNLTWICITFPGEKIKIRKIYNLNIKKQKKKRKKEKTAHG